MTVILSPRDVIDCIGATRTQRLHSFCFVNLSPSPFVLRHLLSTCLICSKIHLFKFFSLFQYFEERFKHFYSCKSIAFFLIRRFYQVYVTMIVLAIKSHLVIVVNKYIMLSQKYHVQETYINICYNNSYKVFCTYNFN